MFTSHDDSPADPIARDVVPRLRCLYCGGGQHALTAHGIRCASCGRVAVVRDGVVHCPAPDEDQAVVAERAAVLEFDLHPRDASGFTIADVLVDPRVQDSVLALPYGDDSPASEYVQNVRKFAPSFDYLLAQLGLAPGASVLDVGADLTWSTSRLARSGYRPIAVDINHHLVAAAVLGARGVPYAAVNVDMHAPAFGDGAFDAITAFNALHHSARLDQLAANLARMLRADGRLGFIEAYWYYPEAKAAFGVDEIAAGINENVYRLEEWHSALVGAGLELVSFAAGRSFDAVYRKTGGPGRRITTADAARELFATFYMVEIEAPQQPVERPCGTAATIDVVVGNRALAAWVSDSQIPVFASYHLNRDGQTVSFDNVRTHLPGYVASGTRVTVPLRVDVPATPGVYTIEVDLVHEAITWFADRGGHTGTATLVAR
jgi:SAM-dependent methyltransferase